jgi:hypothetical protein
MNSTTKLISTLLLAYLVSCESLKVFDDIDGAFFGKCRSESGRFHAVSSLKKTRVFLNQDGKEQLVTEIEFHFEALDGFIKDVIYGANKIAINDEGLIIAHVGGVSLQAWKIDVEGKTAVNLWKADTDFHSRSLFFINEDNFVTVTESSLVVIDIFTGKTVNIFESEFDSTLTSAIKTENELVVVLTRNTLFTISAESLISQNGLVFVNKIENKIPSLLFSLNGLKSNTDDFNHILLFQKMPQSTKSMYQYLVLRTDTLEVVNQFDTPHFYYNPENVEAVIGTDLILSIGNDG